MTTIVYHDGVLAGDTMINCGDQKLHGVIKVFDLGDLLVGICGPVQKMPRILQWIDDAHSQYATDIESYWLVEGLDNHNVFDEDGTTLIVTKDEGELHVISNGDITLLPVMTYATGSGSEYALGALEMGASAVRAIEIASMYDLLTGSDTETVTRSP